MDYEKIYEQYVKYMGKRRSYKINFTQFKNWCSVVDYRKEGQSYVFGVTENGVFIPTHFAPSNLKEGVILLKNLLGDDTCLFVTEDLVKSLLKLGFEYTPNIVDGKLGKDKVKKYLLVSNKGVLKKLPEKIKKNNIDFKKYFEKINSQRMVQNEMTR